ncbi:Synaptosomal-associated protein 25 [Orchesella cincta]|uniref:Synaptosomal-associated protein 25 n=1 Tax=Orchesella cincta TaxID=48709 RepID=A0A1D2NN55_ORCCI|nr:Synaptosomal-associated protein 25 [Orchesella cincta]
MLTAGPFSSGQRSTTTFIQRPKPSRGNGDSNIHDLHKTKEQTNKLTAESVGKTREMLNLMHECQDAGVNTLYMLYEQGDQLKKTERILDETGNEIDQASTRIENIEKKENASLFCLPCVLCCTRDPGSVRKGKDPMKSVLRNDIDVYKNKLADQRNISTEENEHPKVIVSVPGKSWESHRKSATDEEKLENNLDKISVHVSSLKIIAKDMGKETSRHNEQLDTMNIKAQNTAIKLQSATRNVNNITQDKKKSSDETKTTKHFHCCFF